MAKVTFSNVQSQKALTKSVNSRVLADLSATGGKKKPLTNAYEAHIKEVSEKLVKKGAKKIDAEAKKFYKQALDSVADNLASGFSTSGGNTVPGGIKWKPFNRKYFQRKLRETPTTAGLFWRGTGKLSTQFNQFIRGHKGGISRSNQRVKIISTGKKFRNTVFRFRIDFNYPVPTRGGRFFEDILLKSFFQAEALKGTGVSTGNADLDKISFIEGQPSEANSSRHRPFIAQLMANRGKKFRTRLTRILKSQTS